MSDRQAELEVALSHLIQSFATDGYKLQIIGFADGALELLIKAEPHACAECLVPPSIMEALVRTELDGHKDVTSIRIQYPAW